MANFGTIDAFYLPDDPMISSGYHPKRQEVERTDNHCGEFRQG